MAEPHPSALAERLLRRRTDPIGVIDVRPVVQRYKRAAAWPRQHMAVLDRSVTRTSLDAQPQQRLPLTLVAAGANEGARDPLDTSSTAAPERNVRTPSAAPASLMRQLSEVRASSVPRGSDRGDAAAARTAAPRAAATPSLTTVIGPAMHAVSRFAVDGRSASTPVPPDAASQIPRGSVRRAGAEPHEAVSPSVRADELPVPPVVREATTPPASAAAAVDWMPPVARPVWRARAASVRTSDAASTASAPTSMAPPPAQPLVQRRIGTRGTTPVTALNSIGLAMQTSRSSAEPAEMHPGHAGQPAVRQSVPEAVPERPPLDSSIETIYNRALPASPVGARVARASAPTRQSSGAVAAMPLAALGDPVSPRADVRAATTPVAWAEAATAVPNSSARPPAQMVWRRSPAHDANAISRSAAASAPVNAGSSAAGGSLLEPPAAGRIDGPAGTLAPAAGMTPAARQSGAAVNIEQLAQEVMRRIVEQAAIDRERIGEPWR